MYLNQKIPLSWGYVKKNKALIFPVPNHQFELALLGREFIEAIYPG